MRIMATSDLHGNLEGLDPKGADVVMLAGGVAALTHALAVSLAGKVRVNSVSPRRTFGMRPSYGIISRYGPAP